MNNNNKKETLKKKNKKNPTNPQKSSLIPLGFPIIFHCKTMRKDKKKR
jgi:hypothetical protein